MLAVFGFVFARVLDVSVGGVPYLSFAFAGLVCWTFVASSVSGATSSLLGEASTISRAYFQRELVPLAVVAVTLVDLALATTVFLVLLLVEGVELSITLTGLVPLFLVLIVWTMAASILAAAVTVFVRDVRHLLPLALQLGFVATPIMYPETLLPSNARWIADVNPVAVVVDGVRDSALRDTWPDWRPMAVHAVAGVVALGLAVLYTRKVEMRMADVL
jgi:ABC-type polysaccharide/polyol phosphate export permease